MRGGYVALLLAAAVACTPAPPRDPSDEAYHHAVVHFADVSARTGDLTFRGPGFDEVIDELLAVPRGGEGWGKANVLLQRIRAARQEGDASDARSAAARAQALTAPTFEPVTGRGPRPPPAAMAPVAAPQVAGTAATVEAAPASVPGSTALPDWYRQAGYFGLKKSDATAEDTGSPDAAAPETAAPEIADPAAATAAAAAPTAPARPRQVPPPEPVGPPAIFGLPGPAQRAVSNQTP